MPIENGVRFKNALIGKNIEKYKTIIINVSPSCDCSGNPQKPFINEIGIFVSTDIVAIEAAAHDMVDKAHQFDDAFIKANSVSGKHQIEFAYKLKLGNKKYKIIKI